MKKKEAKDILLAHACCSYTNRSNLLCNVCPWFEKPECQGTAFTEEMMIEAIAVMSGNKTMKMMKLDDIYVTETFKNTTPNQTKVEKYREYYKRNGVQAKPIVISENGVLLDGYIQYLILKENDEETAVVVQKYFSFHGKKNKYSTKEPAYRTTRTTYVYGIHPNSRSTKERIWRIPGGWVNMANNLQIGDLILCKVKGGNAQVKITRIETLDKCPVNRQVKRVCRKNYIRNGELVTLND